MAVIHLLSNAHIDPVWQWEWEEGAAAAVSTFRAAADFCEEFDEYPVLMLDDVLSELDSRRQAFVLNRIGGGQTLITCCEDDEITARTGGRVLFVDNGKIR